MEENNLCPHCKKNLDTFNQVKVLKREPVNYAKVGEYRTISLQALIDSGCFNTNLEAKYRRYMWWR